MPSVSQIVNMRQRRRGPGRRLGRTAGLGCSTLLSLLAALGTVVLALAYAQLSRGLPSLEALPGLLEPPDGLLLQPTRLYDRSGEVVLLTLQNPAAAGRQYLRIPGPAASVLDGAQTGQPAGAQVRSTPTPEGLFLPGALISSTLAIAGPGARQPASLLDLWPGFRPTLAQRLVSNLLFESEAPGLGRDLRVRLVASQVITRFGPAKVIEWYLNSASFGHLAYGADAAARVYFGKPAAQLSLAEAALLAGVASDPGSNPLDAPQAALERRKQVIQAMLDQRLIQPGQAEQAQGEALHLRDTSKQPTGGPGSQPVEVQSAAFTSLVLEQIASQAGQTGLTLSRLERGGFRIITTLNADLQAQSTCAAQAQLARLQAAPEAGQPAAGCPAAGLLPAVSAEAGSSPAASGQALASNVIVLDPRTGQLLALVGGPTPDLNPARLPGHSPGTLLTPFIYLTAFTHGSSPATLLWDIPGDPPMKQAQNFLPLVLLHFHQEAEMPQVNPQDWQPERPAQVAGAQHRSIA
ncbi:MAG TPA: transglycosylase domain-containing protein, partial [Anaerolineales bacterium]